MKKITLVVITLLLLVSSGLAQRGGGPKPPPPPANPAIAYVIDGGNANLIAVMNADGSNQTQVYSGGNLNFFLPSWSPLGSGTQLDPYSIAFEVCCTSLRRMDVAVVNGVPQGSNEIILASGGYFNPAWSPTGDEIAVDGYDTGISVVPAGGGAAQTLYTPPAGRLARYPTWSPDASQIAFVELNQSGPGDPVIKILNRATGMVTNTLLQGQFSNIRDLDWARTSDTLAFAAATVPNYRNQDFSIYTLDLPAGSPSLLISGARTPSWSPDDTKLAFWDTVPPSKGGVYHFATGAVTKGGGAFADWRR